MKKSPISILLEYCHKNGLPIPTYEFNLSEGKFECCCKVNKTIEAYGYGTSKRLAKIDAATETVLVINNLGTMDKIDLNIEVKIVPNYVGKLNEICCSNKLPYPVYLPQILSGMFIVECRLLGLSTFAREKDKKHAKQRAAELMLKRFNMDWVDCIEHLQEYIPINKKSIEQTAAL